MVILYFACFARPLLLIYAGETVRVLGIEVDEGGERLAAVAHFALLIAGDGPKSVVVLVFHMKARLGLPVPFESHLAGPGKIKLLDEHFNEIELLGRGAEYALLPLLHVDAGDGDEPCVAAKYAFVHVRVPSF